MSGADEQTAMDWKKYEDEIAQYFRLEFPEATITPNAKIVGRFSKVERQIDLFIEQVPSDFEFRIAVDMKFRNKRIDVNDVESFLGFLRDVDVHKGLLISTEGYTEAAINRAYHDDLDLELDVLNFKDLGKFQAFGAIPYSGDNGAILPAPFGWVVDGTRRQGFVAALYQRGNDLDSARRAREWMYINFWANNDPARDLDSLIKYQESYLMKDVEGAQIELQAGPRRIDGRRTRIRVLTAPSYPTPEYTGFVEFDGFVFFCVLFTPRTLEAKNLRKLRFILRRVLPMRVRQPQDGDAT